MTAAERFVALPLVAGTDVFVPVDRVAEERALLASLARFERRTGEPHVRRFVDLGAGCGTFAAYAGIRWPYAWFDAWEPDVSLHPSLRLNAPVGTRIVGALAEVPRCDALHIGRSAGAVNIAYPDMLRLVLAEFRSTDEMLVIAEAMHALELTLIGAHVDPKRAGNGWHCWARMPERSES